MSRSSRHLGSAVAQPELRPSGVADADEEPLQKLDTLNQDPHCHVRGFYRRQGVPHHTSSLSILTQQCDTVRVGSGASSAEIGPTSTSQRPSTLPSRRELRRMAQQRRVSFLVCIHPSMQLSFKVRRLQHHCTASQAGSLPPLVALVWLCSAYQEKTVRVRTHGLRDAWQRTVCARRCRRCVPVLAERKIRATPTKEKHTRSLF